MNYKISEEAIADLNAIWLYTFENWSAEQADRYYNLIFDEIENLTDNPGSGKDYNEIRTGYYRSKVKSHFIFYKINQNENMLEVIRVLHQQMDVDKRLSD